MYIILLYYTYRNTYEYLILFLYLYIYLYIDERPIFNTRYLYIKYKFIINKYDDNMNRIRKLFTFHIFICKYEFKLFSFGVEMFIIK